MVFVVPEISYRSSARNRSIAAAIGSPSVKLSLDTVGPLNDAPRAAAGGLLTLALPAAPLPRGGDTQGTKRHSSWSLRCGRWQPAGL